MIILLGLYLLFIFALLGLITFMIKLKLKNNINDNKIFYDEDGNHRYYERSLIEKLYFMRKYPDCDSLRTFKSLFSRKRYESDK